MKHLGATRTVLAAVVLGSAQVPAQTTKDYAATNAPPPSIEAEAPAWAFAASIYGYIVPDSRDYVQPTITADRDWLHLEARYNYEALDTGSVWLGYNCSLGEKVTLELTPMLGGVFGETAGVAPGYKGSIGWWKLELYTEGEYVFDLRDSSGSFYYNWSELSLAPVDWFRVGMVTQRTRAYASDRDIQRGFLVGLTYKSVTFTTYVLNPDESRPTLVLAGGVAF